MFAPVLFISGGGGSSPKTIATKWNTGTSTVDHPITSLTRFDDTIGTSRRSRKPSERLLASRGNGNTAATRPTWYILYDTLPVVVQ